MAAKTKTDLQSDIDSNITSCGNGCITGTVLNTALNDHVDSNLNVVVGADISNNLSTGASAAVPVVIKSNTINYKTLADTDIFTVPAGKELLVNAIEFITNTSFTVQSGNALPYMSIGYTTDRDALLQEQPIIHWESGSRFITNPLNLVGGGNTVSVSVISASTVNGTHQGYAVVHGYLV